jgi:hypothetical protein
MSAFLAVDWSGAIAGVRRKMWIAEVRAERLVRLECGRDRSEIVEHLVSRAALDPTLVVGLDFAFSFPRWFVDSQGCADAPDLWRTVERDGERWLNECSAPFWGRAGRRRPPPCSDRPMYRVTESDAVAAHGVRLKSAFQIGGAGAVGTGSIRGMPWLARLRERGFAIWPFDEPRRPLAIEIYPRDLTGRVNKSSALARSLYLAREFPDQDPELVARAASSEDALDAAVSALRMAEHEESFDSLESAADPVARIEGRIWRPAPRVLSRLSP